ncbi:hypothetical protein BDR03DRAFT_954855, partial [Suillus americanus]
MMSMASPIYWPLEPCLRCSNTLPACRYIHSSAAALLYTAFEQVTTHVGVSLGSFCSRLCALHCGRDSCVRYCC